MSAEFILRAIDFANMKKPTKEKRVKKVKLPKNFGHVKGEKPVYERVWLDGYNAGTRDCAADYECGLRKVITKRQ